ncbi:MULTISPECIES: RNA polymerase sigma factor [Paenibacillus]|uniref:RNA polymerase sigma factor n=1 Tax=Paenibacillus TaxID=44249 RepID=UPI000407267F|nr:MULTISPECIES: sigma-70 family RNA polymerase sigma factor [Paenibacillus]KGP84581.1 DNA-directed RNA polymerase subunit sigma [Paenibacillus sp. MAEPY2]KGP86748.1 DNA-directed RNA polymerase subunit sigma [Paenibacillus sp. MAEPY1]OZQ71853.1 RNA polymerase subunit sigma [Paenibacillus taichungensis]HBU83950.1 sigma-70 family RNA polymerase sigma factor [Paenibacillus sp.]
MEEARPSTAATEEIEIAVALVKAGNHEAYTSIIHRFEKPMYIYCYHLLKNREEAQDAVQEIFIKAYQDIHRYQPTVSFSAWLYKLAYHHSLNLLKKQHRRLRIMARFKQQEETQEHIPEQKSAITELLTYLTPEERHILLLKAVEQYNFEEIAQIMDGKPATVRKKYQRLRQKLMEQATKQRRVGGLFAQSNE